MANLQRSFAAGCAGSESDLKRKERLDKILDSLLRCFEHEKLTVELERTHDNSANLTLEKDGRCQNFQIECEYKLRDVVIKFLVLTKTPWYKPDGVKCFGLDNWRFCDEKNWVVVDNIAEHMAFELGKAPVSKKDAAVSPQLK